MATRGFGSVAYPLGCVGSAGGDPGAERASFADALLQDLAVRRLAALAASSSILLGLLGSQTPVREGELGPSLAGE